MDEKANKDENKLMIINRTLSPTHENLTKVIYSGNCLSLKQIAMEVNSSAVEPENYRYKILRLELKSNKLTIYNFSADYNEIINPTQVNQLGCSTHLTFDNFSKKGLIELLEGVN